jgi:hypothetical protein
MIGEELAGGRLAFAMFRTLLKKGLFTADEGRGIISDAVEDIKSSNDPEVAMARMLLSTLRATSNLNLPRPR